MKYYFLSEIGDRYKNEEGTEGRRVVALDVLASELREAMTDLNNLLAQSGQMSPLSPIKGLTLIGTRQRAVGKSQIQPMHRGGTAELHTKIAEASAKVKEYREWLERQGAVVRQDGTIDWGLSTGKVTYDRDLQQQGMTCLEIVNGKFWLGSEAFDTSKMVTYFSGPGYCIYVMSSKGNIHVNRHSVGVTHHSSLLAGFMVACAGEMKCYQGKLLELSNKSGHYRPCVAHLLQILHQLQKKGVPMDFSLRVMPGDQFYTSVGELVATVKANGVADFERARLLRYHQHLTNEILGEHKPDPWFWCDGKAGRGVYRYSNNYTDSPTIEMVPHNEVRRWLKSTNRFAEPKIQSGKGR
jgi:hypothetical protein